MPHVYSRSEMFSLNNTLFLFNHSSTTGQTKISVIDGHGTCNYDKEWSEGWTNIDIYEYKGKTYLFHYKEKTGQVRISELNYNDIMSGKRLGPRVYDKRWSSGWTTTKFFEYGGYLYFFHYKSGTGLVRINISKDGSNVGKKVYEGKWSTGWDNFSAFEHGTLILNQKPGNGDFALKPLNHHSLRKAFLSGKRVSGLRGDSYRQKWAVGYSFLELFQTNGGHKYLLVNKVGVGTTKIYRISNNRLGDRIYSNDIGKGWIAFDIYNYKGKIYMVCQNMITRQVNVSKLSL